MSTYSTFQFLGAFIGGAFGGLIFQNFDFMGVMLFGALFCGVWLLLAFGFSAPGFLKSYAISIDQLNIDLHKFEQHLKKLPGVREVSIVQHEKTAYIKADPRKFDRAFLDDLQLLGTSEEKKLS